jgi:hypothetical protein
MEEGSEKFRNKYRIASARKPGWDYSSAGFYFITICTEKMQNFFGFIKNGIMCVNTAGTVAHWYWREIVNHFHHVYLDAFVVMPNHIHFILKIDHGSARNASACAECRAWVEKRKNDGGATSKRPRRDEACLVSTGTTTSPATVRPNPANPSPKPGISPKSGSLSAVVGSYKSACTKTIRDLCPNINFGWHPRFHDHVIRDGWALSNIRNYIRANPERWKNDVFNK